MRGNLKDNDDLTVENIISTDPERPVSHYFYVQLQTESDTTILDSLIAETNTVLVQQLKYLTLWYELKVSSNSMGNSLEMSNYFYESGLFANIDPGFMLFFSPACSTTTMGNITDPDFSSQWGLKNTADPNLDINACDAWNITAGSSSIKVAVIDMGLHHWQWPSVIPEFASNLSSSYYDAMTGGTGPVVNGNHGLIVGSIIGANKNNQYMVGVAPQTTLVSVFHDLNLNPNVSGQLANGIGWAWRPATSPGGGGEVDVINNSWGTSIVAQLKSPAMESAIDDALTKGRGGKGCVVVFATGNTSNSQKIDTVFYPGYYRPEIIAVGNMEKTNGGRRYVESNGGRALDIVAPGTDVPAILDWNPGTQTVDIGLVTATSYAAPHVSGVVALMLAVNECLNVEDVGTIIEQTAQKVNTSTYTYSNNWPNRHNGSWNWEMGYGLLDAYEAVNKAQTLKTTGKDLYIKDLPSDLGEQPNPSNGPYHTSEDIWIRNQPDGLTTHQNPDYLANQQHKVWVYVKVRNRGCSASGNDES